MRGLIGLFIVGSLFAIGTVLIGGIGNAYEVGDIAVVSGGMLLLAALCVIGGFIAAANASFEVAMPTEAGVVSKRIYRPGAIGLAVEFESTYLQRASNIFEQRAMLIEYVQTLEEANRSLDDQ